MYGLYNNKKITVVDTMLILYIRSADILISTLSLVCDLTPKYFK